MQDPDPQATRRKLLGIDIWEQNNGLKMERSLSREEKEELVRSKKKVKAVNHAGFCDGHSSGPSSPNHDGGL